MSPNIESNDCLSNSIFGYVIISFSNDVWLYQQNCLLLDYEYTEVKTIMVHEFQGELFKNTGKMVQ